MDSYKVKEYGNNIFFIKLAGAFLWRKKHKNDSCILSTTAKSKLSVAFLVGAMKIGAAIAIFVEVSAILFLALAILLASGFFFDGIKSGMTISGAYYISKFAVKIE